jgi:hypothetical protein
MPGGVTPGRATRLPRHLKSAPPATMWPAKALPVSV